jgi:methyltransferase (TIGR00027 family)
MALQRAFESHRPADDRLFTDVYADAFLRGPLRAVAAASKVPILRGLVAVLYDAIAGTGPRPSAIVRSRVIDDLTTALAPKAGQIVILGAGFDSRAHRLPALVSKRVFEVDHPSTQRTKRRIIGQIGLYHPGLSYVPVDFERDALDKRLVAGGFDRKASALYLWEGVTNYLTAEAVGRTLTTVRSLSTMGGILIFTYVHAGVLDGSVEFPEARRWLASVRKIGEPWTFGFRPETLGAYLDTQGYTLESDISVAEARDRLAANQRRLQGASGLYHVAVARFDSPARGTARLDRTA